MPTTTCRPMTHTEKQQLQKLIKKLPPKKLDRVVEIVQRSKPIESQDHDEIFVNLEEKVVNCSNICAGKCI